VLLPILRRQQCRYFLKQRLVRLREIEGFGIRLRAAQIPVDFDHVAVRIVEIEGEGRAVVQDELDRDILLHIIAPRGVANGFCPSRKVADIPIACGRSVEAYRHAVKKEISLFFLRRLHVYSIVTT
jgi:hypothetical protein